MKNCHPAKSKWKKLRELQLRKQIKGKSKRTFSGSAENICAVQVMHHEQMH